MSSAAAVKRLFQRFNLPVTATKAELRKAYFEQAKKLHPDVAGRAGETEFKSLQSAYQEALLHVGKMREREQFGHAYSGSADDVPRADGKYGWRGARSYEEYMAGTWTHMNTSERMRRSSPPPPPPEMTPAQRLRNVVLVAGGVFSLFYMSQQLGKQSPPPQPILPRHTMKKRSAREGDDPATLPEAAVASTAGAAADGTAHPLPVIDLRPEEDRETTTSTPQVSGYYKSRHHKSSLKVREADSAHEYKSVTEPLRSRNAEEGLGSTATQIAALATGTMPSEALPAHPRPRADQPMAVN